MRKRIQSPATHVTLGPESIVIDTPSHLTVHAISYTRLQEKKDVSSVRIYVLARPERFYSLCNACLMFLHDSRWFS